MAIYFQGAGDTGNYFQRFGEQAHSFRNLRSPAKNKKSHPKGKAFVWFFLILRFLGGSRWIYVFTTELVSLVISPKTTFGQSKCIYFQLTCWSGLVLVTDMANNFNYCGKLSLKSWMYIYFKYTSVLKLWIFRMMILYTQRQWKVTSIEI